MAGLPAIGERAMHQMHIFKEHWRERRMSGTSNPHSFLGQVSAPQTCVWPSERNPDIHELIISAPEQIVPFSIGDFRTNVTRKDRC
jgi:hypothetical protein